MSTATRADLGTIVSLLRYPVKSMLVGEELNSVEITSRGLAGDRAYALVDQSDGKAATAKNPRKWPRLFDFRASFVDPARAGAKSAAVRITLPDGAMVTSDQGDRDEVLSKALERRVKLSPAQGGEFKSEQYWPDMEGAERRDAVTEFTLPEGTFFDCAVVHLLTTATLDRLRVLYPEGRFELRRFRPNIVVALASGENGFVENGWIGRTVTIGSGVRLNVSGPAGRCVMTTLPQGDLPRDLGILRAAAKNNGGIVGVYATVAQGGTVRRGDSIGIE